MSPDSEVARIPHVEKQDVITISGQVFATKSNWSRGPRPNFESCSIVERYTGEHIDNLPCAGMDLKCGEHIELTVRRIKP